MEPSAALQTSAADARSLLAAAQTDWHRPVPHCPAWDAAKLVGHMGAIMAWMAAITTSRQRVSRRTLAPVPEEAADLPAWYQENLEQVLAVLGSADPEAKTWTFSSRGADTVAWWHRRLAVEVAVHRWDAEHAVAASGGPPPLPVDGEVAAAGVEEFLVEFLPNLLAREGTEVPSATLHLHATDGPSEWLIDLGAGGTAVAEHAKADAALRATRSDLLLWLSNRGPLDSVEIFGRHEIVDGWSQLRF